MFGWGAILGIIDKVLGLIGMQARKVEHVEGKMEGRAEATAEEAGKIEEARVERAKKDAEVESLSDADLDKRLDKFMRD